MKNVENQAGISDEKKKEISAKSAAIELERDKQLHEIYNKYNGQTEINLNNGINCISSLYKNLS